LRIGEGFAGTQVCAAQWGTRVALRLAFRITVTLISGLGAFYFTFWMGGAILSSVGLPFWTAGIAAALLAALTARYVWRSLASVSIGLGSSILMGAVVVGSLGFSAGFFGPIYFTPGANQGPLLGIFFTGPLGLVVGAIGGGVYWLARGRRA
jgi:hypothetical protein